MIFTILTRYITVLVQFLIIIATIKIYDSEARGIVAALISSFTLVGVLSSLTIGRGLIALNGNLKKSKSSANEIYSSAIYITIFLIVISILIHFLLIRFFPGFFGKIPSDIFKFFYLSTGYFVWTQVGTYLYSLTGRLKVYNTINLISNIVFLSCLIGIYFFNT